jgi:hypothetical protein
MTTSHSFASMKEMVMRMLRLPDAPRGRSLTPLGAIVRGLVAGTVGTLALDRRVTQQEPGPSGCVSISSDGGRPPALQYRDGTAVVLPDGTTVPLEPPAGTSSREEANRSEEALASSTEGWLTDTRVGDLPELMAHRRDGCSTLARAPTRLRSPHPATDDAPSATARRLRTHDGRSPGGGRGRATVCRRVPGADDIVSDVRWPGRRGSCERVEQ